MGTPPDAPPIADVPVQGFDGLYGLEILTAAGDEVCGRVRVDGRHLQQFGLVHGGVYASMAEAMASIGTYVGVGGRKAVAGMSNQTSFLRPAFEGDTIDAVATPRHRGRTTWIWDVECRDGRGRACALVRVTIAVREPRGPQAGARSA